MAENVGHEVIEGVRELLPVLRDRAQEAEDGRVVPADSIKALTETGFFRLLQPAAFGGLEADPLTFYTAARLEWPTLSPRPSINATASRSRAPIVRLSVR